MTPYDWPIVAAAAGVVFGAGRIVEKMRNSRYVKKEMCDEKHKNEDERWNAIKADLNYIRKWIDDQAKGKR